MLGPTLSMKNCCHLVLIEVREHEEFFSIHVISHVVYVGGLKKDEARFRFIQEKYREMKYSSTENRTRILAESKFRWLFT